MTYQEKELRKWDVWARKMKALDIFMGIDVSNCTNCSSFRAGLNECLKDDGPGELNNQMVCPDYKANYYSLN